MLVLDATTRKMKVVLAGAKTTNDCPVVVSYEDNAPGQAPDYATNTLLTSGVTAVDIVPAPPPGRDRIIRLISLFNGDTAAITPSFTFMEGTTSAVVAKFVLQAGETLTYISGYGWAKMNTNGGRVTDATPA